MDYPTETDGGSDLRRPTGNDAARSAGPRLIPNHSSGAPLLLLDKAQVAQALGGVSIRKVEQLVADGVLPAPVTCLGPKSPRWPFTDIVECVDRMSRNRAATPAQLARARIDQAKAGAAA